MYNSFSLIHVEDSFFKSLSVKEVKEKLLLSQVEIPGAWLDSDLYPKVKTLYNCVKNITGVYDILPPNVSRHWCDTAINLSTQLISHLKKLFEKCYKYHITFCSLDLGLDRIPEKHELEEVRKRVEIMRLILAKAQHFNIKILIPMRFPEPYLLAPLRIRTVQFVHEVLNSSLGISLEIIAEEIQNEKHFEELIKKCFFKVQQIRIRYEVGHNKEHFLLFLKWQEILNNQGFEGLYIFVPQTKNLEKIESEIEKFIALSKSQ